MIKTTESLQKEILGAVCIVCLTVIMIGCNRTPPGEDKKMNVADTPTVALVNGESITIDDMEGYLAARTSVGGLLTPDAPKKRLQELVTVRVLAQEARRLKLDQEPEVKFALQQMLAQRLLEQEVIEPVATRAIAADEIEAYYQDHISEYVRPSRVRLADIFISVPADSPSSVWEEKKGVAETIFSEAIQVEGKRFGFSALVQEHSDKHPLYPKGDTGYFDEQGQPLGLDRIFVQAAFAAGVKGRVYAEVVQTPLGYHVIMPVSSRSAVEREVAEVGGEIEQRIRRRELKLKRDAFIKALVEKAAVEINEDRLQELASSADTAGSDGRQGGVPPMPGTTDN